MKPLSSILAFCVVLFAGVVAEAVMPLATWDNDFSRLTKGTCTLDANGNTIADDKTSISVTGAYGILLKTTTAMGAHTLIMRCKGLDLAAANNQVLFSSVQASGTYKNHVGSYIRSSDQKVCGICQGNAWSGGSNWTIPPTYTTLAYNNRPASGTYVYALSPSGDSYSSTTVFEAQGLHFSGATYNGINIGGLREVTNLPPATGLEVTALAVFSATLSEDEIKNFRFGSEMSAYTGSEVKASALNTAFKDQADIYVKLDAGATLILDTTLSANALHIASDGTILVKGTGDGGTTKPDATELAKLDFSAIQGGVRRAWLETTDPLIVGFDFNASCGRQGAGSTTAASTEGALQKGTWASDASSASGTSTALFSDGLSTLTWSSKELWSTQGGLTDGNFLDGYLDDGSGITISLDRVPYDRYDLIIYCARDDGVGNTFSAKTVNGVSYTCDTSSSYAMEGTATWGYSAAAKGTATRGENALVVRGLTGPLTISSARSGARGCISAIQLMPSGLEEKLPTLTIGKSESATWSDASKWDVDTAPMADDALISLQGDVTLDLDTAIAMDYVTVTNAHVLTLSKSVADEVPSFKGIHVEDGAKLVVTTPDITISNCNAPVYNDVYVPTTIVPRANGNVYLVGSPSSAVATLNSTGGYFTLGSAEGERKTFYITGEASGTYTQGRFENVNVIYGVGGANDFSLGTADYALFDANITAMRFKLCDGYLGRTSTVTLNGKSSVKVTGTVDLDSNTSSIMFGHWNGTSVFTMKDESTFTAASQILIGKTGGTHTINIEGGTLTAPGIKLSSSASGANKMNLNGGTLVLGDVGISTYNSNCKMPITVRGNTTIKASEATLPITEQITVAEGATLLLDKVASVGSTVYTLSGASVSGLGTVAITNGVSLNMQTTRFDTNTLLKASESSGISLKLGYAGEIVTLKCSGLTSDRIKLYDTDGTLIKKPSIRFLETGYVVIYKGSPILTLSSETVNFSDAANWSTTDVPLDGEIIILNETGHDVTVEMPSYYSYTAINILSPNARVSFVPTLDQEARLVATEKITINPATATLVITAAESPYENAITGAGKVEVYGDVKMTKASTFTGGITVKSGTLSTETKDGYGGPTDGNGGARVTVEDGASVDLAKVANWSYDLVITGKGVATKNVAGETIYSGAVKNTGSDVTTYNKQMTSLTLQGDALVSADYEWGLVRSSYWQTTLKLNGHTLTKKGRGILAFANTLAPDDSTGAGTIVVEEGTISFEKSGSVFNRVALKMLGTSTLNLEQNLSGLTSLTLSPTAGGITFNNRAKLNASVPITLNAAGFDADDIPAGSTSVVLLKGNENETSFTNGFATVALGGRFKDQDETEYEGLEYSAGGSSVSAKVRAPQNIYHYDFDKDVTTGDIGAATDSYASINWGGEKSGSGPFVVRRGRSGKSAHVGIFDGNTLTPWWNSNDKGRNLQSAGAVTVTTVARLMCADREGGMAPLWGLGSTTAGSQQGLGLVAVDKTTVAVVTWSGGTLWEVCRATNVQNLTTQFHFFAIVLDGYSTRFYVDSRAPIVGESFVPAMGQAGQLGSFHGGTLGGYKKLWSGDGGYYLDDWAVYDAALSTSEIRALRLAFCPSPFIVIMR